MAAIEMHVASTGRVSPLGRFTTGKQWPGMLTSVHDNPSVSHTLANSRASSTHVPDLSRMQSRGYFRAWDELPWPRSSPTDHW